MRLEVLFSILLLVIISVGVANAQQVIQLYWKQDSGNVQYDKLGPYTKINYSKEKSGNERK